MDLTDRVAVVTGGSSGIGLAAAAALGRAGCRLAICARGRERLEGAAQELAGGGAEVLAMPADVSDPDSVEAFAETVREEMGGADILVNNAGIGRFDRIDEASLEDFDAVYGTNVRGVFLCTRAFLPEMLGRGDGVIVNVASLAGKNTFEGGAVYSGSKHAVLAMSRCMMLDLRPRGVRVLAICPGSVDTRFFDGQDRFEPDRGKIVQAGDVARMIVESVRLSDRATVSEVEIRPVNP